MPEVVSVNSNLNSKHQKNKSRNLLFLATDCGRIAASNSSAEVSVDFLRCVKNLVEPSSPNTTLSPHLETRHGNTITDLAFLISSCPQESHQESPPKRRQAVVIFCVKNRIW
jgi:hypothetical protein